MSKKRIPFDITKMNKDFSNVVYRDGTRPKFVCEAKDQEWQFTSVQENGEALAHKLDGSVRTDSRESWTHIDLLLEVDQPYPTLEELSEEQKELIMEFTNFYTLNYLGTMDGKSFKKSYAIFLNSQNK